jgi:hypothetical protein
MNAPTARASGSGWKPILGGLLAGPHRIAIAATLLVVILAAWVANGRTQGSFDTLTNSLIPVALLTQGGLQLEDFATAATQRWGRRPYAFRDGPHGVVSKYPIATGLLATPIMAPEILYRQATARPTAAAWIGHAQYMEKYAAAIITLISVILFALLCQAISFPYPLTIGLSLFYALGSQAFCTSSQILWQHGPGVAFILGALLCLNRLEEAGSKAAAALLSICCGMAIAIRPMDAVLVWPAGVIALARYPRRAAFLLLPGAAIVAAQVAYNSWAVGNLLGGYAGHPFVVDPMAVWQGLLGLLLSPARGLFLYFPIALVAIVLVALRPSLLRCDLALACALATVGAIAFYACFEFWWAGWCVGPRYLTEAEPLLLLLFGMAVGRFSGRARTSLIALAFGVLLPYSIAIQAIGTYSSRPLMWNADRKVPEALWDFVDNPLARAFR